MIPTNCRNSWRFNKIDIDNVRTDYGLDVNVKKTKFVVITNTEWPQIHISVGKGSIETSNK